MRYLLLIACCGVLMLIPATTAQDSPISTASHQNMLASTNGRYVFGQISPVRADQFMLDTQTGRLWQLTTIGTNTEVQLFPIKYAVLMSEGWTHSWYPIDEALVEIKQAEAEARHKAAHP